MMQWKKDPNMKYTDMCRWIDENVEKLKVAKKYPWIEDKIYNYLWLLVKALAIKKRMFNSFQDYDGYAFYAATRLFFALRKNLENQGKIIKGKEIKPIKSCLNYTKALLYPMKIEYLRKTYNDSLEIAAINKKFDTFAFKERLKENIMTKQGADWEFANLIQDTFYHFGDLVDKVLAKSPFEKGSIDYKKVKISLMLNCLTNLRNKKGLDAEPITVQLWKMPKSTASYIKVFLKELGTEVKTKIMENYASTRFDDNVLNYMLSNPEGEFIDHED